MVYSVYSYSPVIYSSKNKNKGWRYMVGNAERFMLNNYERTSSVKEMIADLNWDSILWG